MDLSLFSLRDHYSSLRPKVLEQERGKSIRGIVLSGVIPPLFLERWTGFNVWLPLLLNLGRW